MNKAARLEPIADYAGKVETEAARRLAAAAKALKAKEHEVEQLRSYLAEYRQRAELDQSCMDSLRWQNSRAFLARLSDAVAAHEIELQQAVERYRLEAERWRESHRRAKSLDKVIERGELEALQIASKRDQAELDELVLRRTLGGH
jgi:flagellar export protein FliJ